MKNLNFLFCLIFGVGVFISTEVRAESPVPIQVHFVAADFSFYSFPDPSSEDIIFGSSQAGFDVVFEGSLFGTELTVTKTIVRNGSGTVIQMSHDGKLDCTGHLSYDPSNLTDTPGMAVAGTGPGNTIEIETSTPAYSRNDGVDATLVDSSQPIGNGCRTPYNVYASTGNLTYSPSYLYPIDTPGALPIASHGNLAVIKLNKNLPEGTQAFSYNYNTQFVDTQGNVTETIKTVWFGQMTVTTSAHYVPPPPVNPFTQGGFSPPANGSPPNNPPSTTTVPPAEVKSWIKKNIDDALKGAWLQLEEDWDIANPRSAEFVIPRAASYQVYNPVNKTLTVQQTAAAPESGKLSTVVTLNSKSGRVFAREVSSATGKNGDTLAGGDAINLTMKLTAQGAKTLATGKKFTLVMSSILAPSARAPAVSVSTTVSIKGRGKK